KVSAATVHVLASALMPRRSQTSKKSTRRPPTRSGAAIAIVVSRYNATITDRLLQGALDAHARAIGNGWPPAVIDAPAPTELPALSLAAAHSGRYAGVLALGCIIKGETTHDLHLATAVATGLIGVTLQTGIPVAFGVLTVNNARQAEERAGGK